MRAAISRDNDQAIFQNGIKRTFAHYSFINKNRNILMKSLKLSAEFFDPVVLPFSEDLTCNQSQEPSDQEAVFQPLTLLWIKNKIGHYTHHSSEQ